MSKTCSVFIEPVIRVEIRDNYELVKEFLNWQLDNGIFPIRGSSSSGLGNSLDYFSAEHEESVRLFMQGGW